MAMIIPTILSAFLMYKVHVLENEIKRLSQTNTQKQTEENVINAKEVTKTAATKPTEEQEKKVYLTFDDGPSQQTERILDILKKENVKATFFVIGSQITDDYVDLLSKMQENGHSIGIHTFSHKYREIYLSTDSYIKDFEKSKGILDSFLKKKSIVFTDLTGKFQELWFMH